MILYTPMPLELVFEGLDTSPPRTFEQIVCQGTSVLAEKAAHGQYKVIRVLSTDPAVFLDPGLQPDSLVRAD
ncbi:MAG TPA: YlzJ-like family protein [Spirochaetia bacterium]|nr:YlzJ-like family protein [Spirochaetia bacterium]